jgi:hypothetical protein
MNPHKRNNVNTNGRVVCSAERCNGFPFLFPDSDLSVVLCARSDTKGAKKIWLCHHARLRYAGLKKIAFGVLARHHTAPAISKHK